MLILGYFPSSWRANLKRFVSRIEFIVRVYDMREFLLDNSVVWCGCCEDKTRRCIKYMEQLLISRREKLYHACIDKHFEKPRQPRPSSKYNFAAFLSLCTIYNWLTIWILYYKEDSFYEWLAFMWITVPAEFMCQSNVGRILMGSKQSKQKITILCVLQTGHASSVAAIWW